MPAKWQQWMPFYIDAFMGSPSVQAMHPTARLGYICLLLRAWQSEDCTIPSDPLELAEKSTLGDKLWSQHGPRILRKFESVDGNGKLRNEACYQRWLEAKRIFEARKEAAHRTNDIRSPHGHRDGHPTQTDENSARSGDTRTTVVPVPVDVGVSVHVNGDSGSELGIAAWVFEEANVPCDNSLIRVLGDCVRKLAREAGICNNDAGRVILDAMKFAIADGEQITRFWLTDQRYKPQKPKNNSKRADLERERAEIAKRVEESLNADQAD